MAATWDNEDATSSESEQEEKANLALMAGLEQHQFEISFRLLCPHPFFAPSCSPAKDLQKSSAKPHPLEKKRHRVNLPAVILERMIAAKDLQESLPYGSLLTMIFKKHSVDLSEDVPMSTKEKIGLITLRRSHYSLVGKKQNLWYKDSVPECEHEVYPDEPLVSLLTQDIPASSIQIKAPPVPAIPNVFVQPPEPIVEQVAQPVIPPEVPSEDAQLPASSSLPEQDAPSETVHEVLRDLRGKGILSEDVHVSPMEHIFEEREPSYSPSQFETRPRS
ncbi:hypothetical protein Taro_002682 [Colocasia esculenta]|uniref:Uncharacterized protein n=1 Tax=Colocasia esculenta TaxID=4460 RepID=A0A843TM51_COLES|nr:hypothetical protein [Colocasia esculenta]